MKTILHFQPAARIQRFLGRELIADPNVAVAEFVKNAWDAGATEVFIDLIINSKLRNEQVLIVSDNGTGMDLEYFKKNWMRPGFSSKAKNVPPIPPNALPSAKNLASKRTQIGEKGLGRLASGRLGERLHIFTRIRPSEPWLHIDIKWLDFETMDRGIEEIGINVDDSTQPKEARVKSGTILRIEDSAINWTGTIPGRPVQGRSSLRLGRLQEDLSILAQPLPGKSVSFRIHLNSDSPELEDLNGWIKPSEPSFIDYRFDFSIKPTNTGFSVKRTITRSKDVSAATGKDEETSENAVPVISPEIGEGGWNCGAFSGRIFYSPKSAPRYKELGVFPGVFLYRDGIRVDPYGLDGNDWLGATAWKATRQGHAPIQPKFLTGYIKISKDKNKELRDMSNRQGLLDNPAYRSFISLVQEEFRWFGDQIYKEYVPLTWEGSEEKAQRETERTQRLGFLIIRALAHSIRQSTAGLGAEMSSLKKVAERLQPEISVLINGIEARSKKHINRIDAVVNRFLSLEEKQSEQPEEFDINETLGKAIEDLQASADSHGVELIFEKASSKTTSCVFNKHILVQSITELAQNSIEASAVSSKTKKIVKIRVSRTLNEKWEIVVNDNGDGIDARIKEKIFLESNSTKGRPGGGLLTIKELLTLAGGDVELIKSSSEGSEFKISIPTKKGW